MTSVVMVTGIRPIPSSNSQPCETPIFLYTGEKLQHIHGLLNELAEDLCPRKLAPDGQWVQSVPKLIRRSSAIQLCSSQSATSTDKSGLYVCRIPDCLAKPCQNHGQCKESIDSFQCLCTSGFSGKTCEIAIPSTSKLSTSGSLAMATDLSTKMTTIETGMERTIAMSTTIGYHGNHLCPAGWDAFERKCYKYSNYMRKWQWHFDNCENLSDGVNATMLVIESEEEEDFIVSSYGKDGVDIWLGCNRPKGAASIWKCPATGAKWPRGPQDHHYWRIRPFFSANAQSSCETPIYLYTGEKLQHIHGQIELTEDHCPRKLTPDGLWVQSVPKLIRRSAAIQSCSSRSATSTDKPGLFVCRIPDCLAKPCQNHGHCKETIDSFKCLCTSGFSGKTCEIAIPSTPKLSTTGSPAMATDLSTIMTSTETGMEGTIAMSTTIGFHSNSTCPSGWDAFERKCYKCSNNKKKWQWHFDNCKNLSDGVNATMLVIESEEEEHFIVSSYGKNSGDIWLGCHRPAEASAWNCPATGAKWSRGQQAHHYWNWDSGEPTDIRGQDNCLRLHLEDKTNIHTWKDRGCDKHQYRSVCQMQI